LEIVLAEAPASVLTQPAIIVAPLTVMFEKLLLLLLITLPEIDDATHVKSVTVPPAVLVKAPLIELLFTFCVPVAGTITLFEMNVIFPDVLTLRLVKVLLLMTCERVAAVFDM
jgi:hypothetical protein